MASNKKSSTSAVYLTKLGRIKSWTVFFCLVGLVLSGYALFVEHQKEKDETYTAMCDINEHVSCSKVFTSKYGKGFGLLQFFLDESSPLIQPNPVYGLAFYVIILLLAFGHFLFVARVNMILCAIANLGSVYLGYILYFVLQDLCVVCISTYAVNFALLIIALVRVSYLKGFKLETGGPILYAGGLNKTKKRV